LFFCFLGAQAHTYYISIIKKQQFSNARLVPHLSYNKKGGADAANKKGENKKQGEGVIIKFWSQDWCPTSLTTSGVDAAN
jgi:hypothetical protein